MIAHLVEKVHRFQLIVWSKADTPAQHATALCLLVLCILLVLAFPQYLVGGIQDAIACFKSLSVHRQQLPGLKIQPHVHWS